MGESLLAISATANSLGGSPAGSTGSGVFPSASALPFWGGPDLCNLGAAPPGELSPCWGCGSDISLHALAAGERSKGKVSWLASQPTGKEVLCKGRGQVCMLSRFLFAGLAKQKNPSKPKTYRKKHIHQTVSNKN